MKKVIKFFAIFVIILLAVCYNKFIVNDNFSKNQIEEKEIHEENIINPSGETLATRIAPPKGYERIEKEEGSLAQFLRNYQMKEDSEPLLLYNGSKKINQNSHAAIFALPIENEDLQQCADSIMRVYAEYYWNMGKAEKIAFHFTDGFLCEYSKWRDGYRVSMNGNTTSWQKKAEYDNSYEGFVKYLRIVFSYAGTHSMRAYEADTIELSKADVGDVILKGGSPGHVVMIVDMCKNDEGKKAFLLAQGYMPAQEFHVILNPMHRDNPWYYEEEITFPLQTAEYTFENRETLCRLKY